MHPHQTDSRQSYSALGAFNPPGRYMGFQHSHEMDSANNYRYDHFSRQVSRSRGIEKVRDDIVSRMRSPFIYLPSN